MPSLGTTAPARPSKPIELDPDLEPWERQPREIDVAWGLFQAYRDMNGSGRSYARLCRESGKKPSYKSQVERYARRYRWRDRVEAWDREEDRRDLARREERKDAMEERHRAIGAIGTGLLLRRLQGGAYELPDGTTVQVAPIDPNQIDWARLAQLLPAFVHTERLAAGMPTDFLKGAVTLTTTDVTRILSIFLDVAQDFWGEDERWGLFIERLKATPLGGS